jgi:hypothetical protein
VTAKFFHLDGGLSVDEDYKRSKAGMEPEREAQVLEEWQHSPEQAEDELAVS